MAARCLAPPRSVLDDEDVTNELVDWFNNVDATYRADLRELNELNFARFDAKLEQRLAALGIVGTAVGVALLLRR